VPNIYVWIGGAIVIASVSYIVWREHKILIKTRTSDEKI
jgi:drug/metabolite transporter (DMT)-like permease